MTEAQLITQPISITGLEGVVRHKEEKEEWGSADKRWKEKAVTREVMKREERRGEENPCGKPRGFWTWCSITAPLIALWLGGVADESDSLPQWVTLHRDADGIVIAWCCSRLCGHATGCDHSSLNLWRTRRCFLILSVSVHHISVRSQLHDWVFPHMHTPGITSTTRACPLDKGALGEINSPRSHISVRFWASTNVKS